VLHNLGKAMDTVNPVKISLEKTETKPEFVYMVGPNDLVISVVFSVKGDEFSGELHLCIPYLVLEPIREKLSSRYIMEKGIAHSFSDKIRNVLNNTNITLIAELGRTVYTIRDILNIQVGDILKLNTGPKDLITINVEEIPKYQGVPGVVRGNRAVQVTRLFR
ncbi:FliM/FliN family flagellar motor switch protein, partial [Patescibacteria group bacterium]|nr:FliM/FliN family flagellar motor switch protein [Patescibacteria group bacterium]